MRMFFRWLAAYTIYRKRLYRCENCEGLFLSDWSDEEAREEYDTLFPGTRDSIPPEEKQSNQLTLEIVSRTLGRRARQRKQKEFDRDSVAQVCHSCWMELIPEEIRRNVG